jgi:adenine deaminase
MDILRQDYRFLLQVSNLKAVNQAALKLGSNVTRDPFMLLSFLALPVIPTLKLTDRGLVDVEKYRFTSLWADET